jgi:hypothetical protein
VNENGLQSAEGRPEYFFRENVPPEQPAVDVGTGNAEEVKNQLF